jgi:hypothetical protein
MKIHVSKQQAERVGILGFLHAICPGNAEPIRLEIVDQTLEQTVRRPPIERTKNLTIGSADDLHACCGRKKGAHHPSLRRFVRSKNRERISQNRVSQGLCPGVIEAPRRGEGHRRHDLVSAPSRTRCASVASPATGTGNQVGRLAAS